MKKTDEEVVLGKTLLLIIKYCFIMNLDYFYTAGPGTMQRVRGNSGIPHTGKNLYVTLWLTPPYP